MVGCKVERRATLADRTAAVRKLAVSIGLSRVVEINKQEVHGSSWRADADLSQRYISIDAIDHDLYKLDLDLGEGDLPDVD